MSKISELFFYAVLIVIVNEKLHNWCIIIVKYIEQYCIKSHIVT